MGSNAASWFAFRHALQQPGTTQRSLLRSLLASNARCTFGKTHHFGTIKSYKEFSRTVPLMEHGDLLPWVDRIRAGESNLLTTEPVTHLVPTSGSSGGRKLIPFTRGLQAQFDRAIAPWVSDLIRHQPGLLLGPAYWSISPARQAAEATPSAVPIGFEDDASYLGGVKGWLVRSAMAVSNDLGRVEDIDEFHFRTWSMLLAQRDLRLISVWHPSFLTLLLDALPVHWERIIADLYNHQKRRVRELSKMGPRHPEQFWPNLQLISCWGDCQSETALNQLQGRFPAVRIQAKGLLATEAFVTIPFGNGRPLAIRSHFFEFLDTDGRIHLADELRDGESYEVIITTAGGLWRYRLGDTVEVTGFAQRTPSLRFIGRTGGVSDLCGEKLSESFVADLLNELTGNFQPRPTFRLLAPDHQAAGLGYTLYIEGDSPEYLAGALDEALRQNPNYAHARDLGQLQPILVFSISGGGLNSYTQRLLQTGMSLGDIKPSVLSRDVGWSGVFSGCYAINSGRMNVAAKDQSV